MYNKAFAARRFMSFLDYYILKTFCKKEFEEFYRYPIGFSNKTGTKIILCFLLSCSETVVVTCCPTLYVVVGGIFSLRINPSISCSEPAEESSRVTVTPASSTLATIPLTFLSTGNFAISASNGSTVRRLIERFTRLLSSSNRVITASTFCPTLKCSERSPTFSHEVSEI